MKNSILNKYKTEIIGISAEVAIADCFNVPVSGSYRSRGDADIIANIQPNIPQIFYEYEIPRPVEHIAERQNPIDFLLLGDKTLSVKTNQGDLGKVAPQIIGQPTSLTYFKYFKDFIGDEIPILYHERVELFKKFSIDNIDLVIQEYWKNLFNSDFMVYFFNVLDKNKLPNEKVDSLVLLSFEQPMWDKNNFSFTQTLDSWNESNTVKYCGVSIGEFQVHNNRDCFKFRFDMKKIMRLIDNNVLVITK